MYLSVWPAFAPDDPLMSMGFEEEAIEAVYPREAVVILYLIITWKCIDETILKYYGYDIHIQKYQDVKFTYH